MLPLKISQGSVDGCVQVRVSENTSEPSASEMGDLLQALLSELNSSRLTIEEQRKVIERLKEGIKVVERDNEKEVEALLLQSRQSLQLAERGLSAARDLSTTLPQLNRDLSSLMEDFSRGLCAETCADLPSLHAKNPQTNEPEFFRFFSHPSGIKFILFLCEKNELSVRDLLFFRNDSGETILHKQIPAIVLEMIFLAYKQSPGIVTQEASVDTLVNPIRGFEINESKESEEGTRPIHLVEDACAAKVFIQCGAQLQAVDELKRNALHTSKNSAVRREILQGYRRRILSKYMDESIATLESYAYVNKPDSFGRIPMHYAHDKEDVQILRSFGSDPDRADLKGKPPLLTAPFVNPDSDDVLNGRYLASKLASSFWYFATDTLILGSVHRQMFGSPIDDSEFRRLFISKRKIFKDKSLEIVEALCERCISSEIDLSQQDKEGVTLLHYAYILPEDLFNYLLAKEKVDHRLRIRDSWGYTPRSLCQTVSALLQQSALSMDEKTQIQSFLSSRMEKMKLYEAPHA